MAYKATVDIISFFVHAAQVYPPTHLDGIACSRICVRYKAITLHNCNSDASGDISYPSY
jgi:hypothetical protein